MTAFNVGKSSQNPAGEPLYAAARRIRLDLEGQMVARRDLGDDAGALQAVGLLLQIEGLDRQMRSQRPLEAVDGTNRSHVVPMIGAAGAVPRRGPP